MNGLLRYPDLEEIKKNTEQLLIQPTGKSQHQPDCSKLKSNYNEEFDKYWKEVEGINQKRIKLLESLGSILHKKTYYEYTEDLLQKHEAVLVKYGRKSDRSDFK